MGYPVENFLKGIGNNSLKIGVEYVCFGSFLELIMEAWRLRKISMEKEYGVGKKRMIGTNLGNVYTHIIY